MKKRKIKLNNNIFFDFLIFIFLVLFFISLLNIYHWYVDNTKSNKVLKSISNDIVINKNTNEYKINFSDLKKVNSDVVAFIKVYGTNIEYPIVKTVDNSYYLDHSFDKRVNSAGWPFINSVNTFDGTDKNITIFSHARRDGSMFGSLYKTLSSEWRNKKDNLKILFITEQDTQHYQVFSTYKVLEEDYYIMNSFNSNQEYIEFLNKIRNRSNYDYGISLDVNDSIITLSTCSSDDRYRIVLHAKKIKN